MPKDALQQVVRSPLSNELDNTQVVSENIPDWLKNATPEAITALQESARLSQHYKDEVLSRLKHLKSLKDFVTPLLEQALLDTFGEGLDVQEARLYIAKQSHLDLGFPVGAIKTIITPSTSLSLLEAALQNFEAYERFAPGSGISRIATGTHLSTVTVDAFARLSRELNLGGKYQDHLCEVFHLNEGDSDPSDSQGFDIRFALMQLKSADLRVELDIAFAKRHIEESTYKAIRQFVVLKADVELQGKPVQVARLSIFGCCLDEVLLFSATDAFEAGGRKIVAYFPNHPVQVVKVFASFDQLLRELTRCLKEPSYQKFFAQFVRQFDLPTFYSSLKKNSALVLKREPVQGELFAFLTREHVVRLQEDARVIAVPTQDVDEQERRRRIEQFLGAGLRILNVAAFVVPGLGELMLGVAVGQMLAEVYEGVEDWQAGERAEGITHLLSVVEDIAIMAVTGKLIEGAKGVVKGVIARQSSFFDMLEPVALANGNTKLWRPSLIPFEQSFDLFDGKATDDEGFYLGHGEGNNRKYLKIGGMPHEVFFDEGQSAWRVSHPTRQSAYAPVLERMPSGGWKLELEDPEEWQGALNLFRRLSPVFDRLSNADIHDLLKINGLDQSILGAMLREPRSIPGSLTDSIKRLRIDRTLSSKLNQLADPKTPPDALLPLQIEALQQLPGWPKGRTLHLESSEQPPAISPDSGERKLIIPIARVRQGQGLQAALELLDEEEGKELSALLPISEQTSSELSSKLAVQARLHRRLMFDRAYGKEVATDDVLLRRLARQYPNISAPVLADIMSDVPAAFKEDFIDSQQLKLPAVDILRRHARQLRFRNALEGGFLDSVHNPDTDTLLLQAFGKLPKWPSDLRIEVRDSPGGKLLDSLGSMRSAVTRTLIKSDLGYEVLNPEADAKAGPFSGPDALCEAVAQAMPHRHRDVVATLSGQPLQLRRLLADMAASDRGESELTLLPERHTLRAKVARELREQERAACRRGRRGTDVLSSRSLLRRVRNLYPGFCEGDARTFLASLGSEDKKVVKDRLKALKGELVELQKTLLNWAGPGDPWRVRVNWLGGIEESREQVALVLERCWRRQTMKVYDEQGTFIGHHLGLNGMQVGTLPELPPQIDFSHVADLSMNYMRLRELSSGFIGRFSKLRTLDLHGNMLGSLPLDMAKLTELRRLHLSANNIHLDSAMIDTLAQLGKLRVLDLSGNNVRGRLNVNMMPELRELNMRNTLITEWPEGLLTRPRLQSADLRDNHLRDVPLELFEAPLAINERTFLTNNRFTEHASAELEAYRVRTGITFGVVPRESGPTRDIARQRWLAESPGEFRAQREDAWRELAQAPNGGEFFRLLGELASGAEYEKNRTDLSRRVWEVVEEAYEHPELREELFNLAGSPLTCVDSASVNFSALEVRVLLSNAMAQTQVAGGAQAGNLLKLARGLFRFEKINDIAFEHIERLGPPAEAGPSRPVGGALARRSEDELRRTDELEVNLAYRVGLSKHVYLPGQPQQMRFTALSGVTEEHLEEALEKIRQAEGKPEMTRFIASRDFWIGYLKQRYAHRFNDFDLPFHEEQEKLLKDSPSMDSRRYMEKIADLMKRREAGEKALREELTAAEEKENPELM